ncbi:RCC1/BLIP-II [Morchella conica CCBAS932]|uniref:RCC1/BLIP-II n=1 Tax=Morchella conica CCBAS932 TaxID=1392247 RepID=A0A3N4L0P0_9PEZI|nr:RCC1/BLIP-II [Morchella conica CCBAS932]
MFKQTTSSLCWFSRAIPGRVLSTRTTLCRSISTARTAKPVIGKGPSALIATAIVGGFVIYQLATEPVIRAEEIAVVSPAAVDLKSKLSAQHVQVKNSWEHPGVYAWGNNVGRVVAPDSNEDLIKSPRRISAFDNVLLRDLKLDRNIGVAVNEKGDILQWGTGYAPDIKEPEKTLTGKDITTVEISGDRVFALSKDGKIYSLPMSKKDQTESTKLSESSWIPGVSSESKISYRLLKPELGYFESISKIASGRDHILILTSSGRVFSAAASYHYPSKGELGIPGLTFVTRPKDKPYDTCHEITHLSDYKITQIAAGDHHSLVLDDAGRVFSFGDNTSGQLGFPYNSETNHIEVPTLLTFQGMYDTKQIVPKVKKIEAGGANSYFCVDAENIANGKVSADLFSCGTGIFGNLGNGRWTHVQGTPTKVKALSGLFEYDDKANSIVPIRLSSLSVGATHISATMQNLTNVEASTSTTSPAHDVNFGFDVLWWGNNEFYQLGTGKRNNTSVPVYIPPLEPMVAEMMIDESSMTGSSSTGDLTRKSGIIGGKGDEVGSARFTRKDQVHRFQATPKKKVNINGKNVEVEQRVACGRGNSAVYSAV